MSTKYERVQRAQAEVAQRKLNIEQLAKELTEALSLLNVIPIGSDEAKLVSDKAKQLEEMIEEETSVLNGAQGVLDRGGKEYGY